MRVRFIPEVRYSFRFPAGGGAGEARFCWSPDGDIFLLMGVDPRRGLMVFTDRIRGVWGDEVHVPLAGGSNRGLAKRIVSRARGGAPAEQTVSMRVRSAGLELTVNGHNHEFDRFIPDRAMACHWADLGPWEHLTGPLQLAPKTADEDVAALGAALLPFRMGVA